MDLKRGSLAMPITQEGAKTKHGDRRTCSVTIRLHHTDWPRPGPEATNTTQLGPDSGHWNYLAPSGAATSDAKSHRRHRRHGRNHVETVWAQSASFVSRIHQFHTFPSPGAPNYGKCVFVPYFPLSPNIHASAPLRITSPRGLTKYTKGLMVPSYRLVDT